MEPANCHAIIVAGGKGLRMGGTLPKQFMPLGSGRFCVLQHTLMRFEEALPGIDMIVVLPADHIKLWKKLCEDSGFRLKHRICEGGATRFESVSHGLDLLEDEPASIVGVHDGVRPFVGTDVIKNCFHLAQTAGAVVPVLGAVESIRFGSATHSHAIDRSKCWMVQTPQTFRTHLLKEAYRQPYRTSFTDDASVVEAWGHTITLTEGNRENIKLTTPFDRAVAKAFMNPPTVVPSI